MDETEAVVVNSGALKGIVEGKEVTVDTLDGNSVVVVNEGGIASVEISGVVDSRVVRFGSGSKVVVKIGNENVGFSIVETID